MMITLPILMIQSTMLFSTLTAARLNSVYHNHNQDRHSLMEEKCFSPGKEEAFTNHGFSKSVQITSANQQLTKFNAKSPAPEIQPECQDCKLFYASSSSVQKKKYLKKVYVLVAGLIAVISVILATVSCLVFFLTKKRLTDITEASPVLDNGDASEKQPFKLNVRRFDLKEMEAATQKFSPESLIGSGAFAKVYKGILKGYETVAIKRANRDKCPPIQEFHNEVKLLSEIRHMNIVSLIGFCDAADEQILVYEYIPNGSLLEHIGGFKHMPLTWKQRVQIAIGAARGIAHLHEDCNPPIIHRDIKPSNILVNKDFEAKVADFGLVRAGPVEDESYVSSLVKGTPGYLDPHYYSSCHLSASSDVYSFGVTLLQLVTARPAVDLSKKQPRYNIIDWARPSLEQGDLENILDSSLLTQPYNREMMLLLGHIGLRCVGKLPKERPTMMQIYQELQFHMFSQTQPCISFVEGDKLRESSFQKEEESSKFPFHNKKDSTKTSLHTGGKPINYENQESDSFVSLENAGLEKFEIEMDKISFDSINLRCLDCNSIGLDVDKNNIEKMSNGNDTNSSSSSFSF